jgi:hypothetical protein
MSQVHPTSIVNLILLKIFPLFLESIALRTATSYGPQAAQADVKPPSESSLDLTLTQHLRDEEPKPREVHTRLEVEPPRVWYYHILPIPAPWRSYYKLTPLLVTNPKLSAKVVVKPKTLLSSLGLQFPALDTIIGCTVRFVDYLLIAKRTT